MSCMTCRRASSYTPSLDCRLDEAQFAGWCARAFQTDWRTLRELLVPDQGRVETGHAWAGGLPARWVDCRDGNIIDLMAQARPLGGAKR